MNIDSTEASIRSALLKFLKSKEEGECAFLNEMFVEGFSRRADLVVANGRLAAFEIKSAADNLSRLHGQLESYKKNFEEVTVICASNHLSGVRQLASFGVGVLSISPEGEIKQVRKARYSKVTKNAWLSFLPVIRLRELLKKNKVRHSHLRDRQNLLDVSSRLPYEAIRSFALSYIKLRDKRSAAYQNRRTQSVLEALNKPEGGSGRIEDWNAYYEHFGNEAPIPRKAS